MSVDRYAFQRIGNLLSYCTGLLCLEFFVNFSRLMFGSQYGLHRSRIGSLQESIHSHTLGLSPLSMLAFLATNQMQNLLEEPVKRPINAKWPITVNRQQNAQAAQAYVQGETDLASEATV